MGANCEHLRARLLRLSSADPTLAHAASLRCIERSAGQPTYFEMMELASQLQGATVLLANADIGFDDTLEPLADGGFRRGSLATIATQSFDPLRAGGKPQRLTTAYQELTSLDPSVVRCDGNPVVRVRSGSGGGGAAGPCPCRQLRCLVPSLCHPKVSRAPIHMRIETPSPVHYKLHVHVAYLTGRAAYSAYPSLGPIGGQDMPLSRSVASLGFKSPRTSWDAYVFHAVDLAGKIRREDFLDQCVPCL